MTPDWHEIREQFAVKNEQLFRDHNQRLDALEEQGHAVDRDDPLPFVCECGRAGCLESVRLSLAEWERLHTLADRFAVKPGHENPDVEVVVRRHDRYYEVEKPALAS